MNADKVDISSIFNPSSTQPPFSWKIALPPLWAPIDTRPDKIDQSAHNFVSDYFPEVDPESTHFRDIVARVKLMEKYTKDEDRLSTLLLPIPTTPDYNQISLSQLILRWRFHPGEVFGENSFTKYCDEKRKNNLHAQFDELKTREGMTYFLIEEDRIENASKVRAHHGSISIPRTSWTLLISAVTEAQNYHMLIRSIVQEAAESLSIQPSNNN